MGEGGIIFDDVFIVLLQYDIHLSVCDTVGVVVVVVGGGDQSWVKDNSKGWRLGFGPHKQRGAELEVPPPLVCASPPLPGLSGAAFAVCRKATFSCSAYVFANSE